MSRNFALILLGASIVSVSIARSQSAILWNDTPQHGGFEMREETTIRLEGGKFMLGAANGISLNGAANALVRDIVERSFVTPDQQKVDVLDSTRSIHFSFGSKGEPKDEAGHLLGKKLVGKKTNGRWTYSLANSREPDSAERAALKQFASYTEVVDAIGKLYGPEPRKVGEEWKPDLGALKNLPAGFDANVKCKLEDIGEHKGERCAHISLNGRLQAGVGDGGTVSIKIDGNIFRSLRDLVDVDTEINGSLKYHGAFGGSETNADIEAPVKLTRFVKVEKR